jgi:hypothetical protein
LPRIDEQRIGVLPPAFSRRLRSPARASIFVGQDKAASLAI